MTDQRADPYYRPTYREPGPDHEVEIRLLKSTLFGPMGTNGMYGDLRQLKGDIRQILDTMHAIEEIQRRVSILEEFRQAQEAAKKHRLKAIFEQVTRWAIGGVLSLIVFLAGFYINNHDKIP